MNERISLMDVWMEAMDDNYSSALDGEGIYNTSKGGNFYTEVENLDPFFEGGWRYGVYTTALQNYKDKLDKVEDAVRHEVNGKNNPKQITSLKNARIRLLNKYNNISDKLNKIK